MKMSDLFVKSLEAEGVRRIFGVPGEENAHVMLSLENSEIEFVLTRHEQGAAFMAEVHGRLTGEAGVCLGTLGPGATNLITGVADANMDRAPVVAITGQADSERLHKESHQAMDVVSMFRPVTKWANSILHPDSTPEVVRKAFKLATTEKPGACLIEIPEDIAEAEAKTTPFASRRIRRPVADDKIVDRAWECIRQAKQPIILAGNGTIRKRASKQLRAFVKQTGIGVLSTFMAKGCIDMDDPACLFTIGLQARDYTSMAIERADLVITIGYDMVEYHPYLWNIGCCKKIVHFDFVPAEVDEHYHTEVEVVGDLAHSIWMLNERVARDGVPDFDFSFQKTVREELQKDFAEHAEDDTEGLIRPQKILWDIRQVLNPQDILLSDVGAHKMWIGRYYQCHEPNTCLIPNGFCSMGFALPGAIAAAMESHDRNVLAICGDGGFMMNVQEMETAKRLNLDLTVVVWVDGGYGLISWKQDTQFGHHTDLAFGNPDFMTLAKAFGWSGHQANNSRDLKAILETAIAEKGPSLVAIPVDYRENPLLTQRLGHIICPL